MAVLQDLIAQVSDPALREKLSQETDKLLKQKKFGLVFEEHLPECTPLFDIPVRVGSAVALKTGYINDVYTVVSISGKEAVCRREETNEQRTIPLNDLVSVASFGKPIYPCLKLLDSVCNAPDSGLWHTLIEADNYHALQLMDYLYAGKVDCIYIDPPYNTGAHDWKYNNDYVDATDTYRHSKWLSMMEKRLKLAKRLLNPKDSVLIVTIDEKEYLHLGCLLEELFPEARMQMISSVINPKGVSVLKGFRRADEYLFFIMNGESKPNSLPLGNEWSPSAIKSSVRDDNEAGKRIEPGWTSMMRRGSNSARSDRPGLYYAIYVNPDDNRIVKIGNPLPDGISRDVEIEGTVQVLPIRTNKSEGRWQVGPTELKARMQQGRVRLGKKTSYGYVINYLPDGEYEKIKSHFYTVDGYAEDGSIIAHKTELEQANSIAPTQWKIALHDASAYGSTLLSTIIGEKRFAFPKSLYAVHDTLRFFVANKPNALIVDFFAGSGTTLHAVNLLNAEDGGNRRCILVTNNEISNGEAAALKKQGYQPGDPEWEKYGIARYVTWPRTVCSIEGHDVNGVPLKGNYLGSDIPMSDGFQANAAFFKLGFLDKTLVALGTQFRELLSVLWMKAGAIGKCPVLDSDTLPDMLVLPENQFAVLVEETSCPSFYERLDEYPEIKTVFIVTDSASAYREMIRNLEGKDTYQLYRDYLDNFRINVGRQS